MTQDRKAFLASVWNGWNPSNQRQQSLTLPTIFKAYRPFGHKDNGHLNRVALEFLYNSLRISGNNFDWSEYTQIDPIDQFLVDCLKDTAYNTEVWALACSIKQISRSDLLLYFTNRPEVTSSMLSAYQTYDILAQLADIAVAFFLTISSQFLLVYFQIIKTSLVDSNNLWHLGLFVFFNILLSRIFYNNFIDM